MTTKLDDKLFWEATRHFESIASFDTDAHVANKMASQSQKSFFQKLTIRDQFLDNNRSIRDSLNTVTKRGYLTALIVFGISIVLGIFAAGSLLDSGQKTLNFYSVIVSFLAVNFITLVLWLILQMFKVTSSPLTFLWTLIQKWMGSSSEKAAITKSVTAAWVDFFSNSHAGRWMVYSMMHINWVCFLLGAWMYTLFLMTTQQYQFIWESTLLPKESFVQITQAIAWLPELMGFTTPNIDNINNSELSPDKSSASAWASLLSGAMLIYGILPRLLFALYSFIKHLILRKKWLPNFQLPYYQSLKQQLYTAHSEVVDPDLEKTVSHSDGSSAHSDISHLKGTWAVLGLEYTEFDEYIPEELPQAILVNHIGFINDRASRQTALETIENQKHRNVILICDLDTVPDRGLSRTIKKIKAVVKGELQLLLLQDSDYLGEPLVAQRQADWLFAIHNANLKAEDLIFHELAPSK